MKPEMEISYVNTHTCQVSEEFRSSIQKLLIQNSWFSRQHAARSRLRSSKLEERSLFWKCTPSEFLVQKLH